MYVCLSVFINTYVHTTGRRTCVPKALLCTERVWDQRSVRLISRRGKEQPASSPAEGCKHLQGQVHRTDCFNGWLAFYGLQAYGRWNLL